MNAANEEYARELFPCSNVPFNITFTTCIFANLYPLEYIFIFNSLHTVWILLIAKYLIVILVVPITCFNSITSYKISSSSAIRLYNPFVCLYSYMTYEYIVDYTDKIRLISVLLLLYEQVIKRIPSLGIIIAVTKNHETVRHQTSHTKLLHHE